MVGLDPLLCQRVRPERGYNVIAVRAVDEAGNATVETVRIDAFALPTVTIDQPATMTTTAAAAIDVQGRFTGAVTGVVVGGVTAGLSADAFVASGVPLHEGSNLVTAVANDAQGRAATAVITVVRDSTPPSILLRAPLPGSTVNTSPIAVSGEVLDLVIGATTAGEPAVTVAGVPVTVSQGAFLAPVVDLLVGDNLLLVEAVDESGNSSQLGLTVRFEPVSGRRASDPSICKKCAGDPPPLEELYRAAYELWEQKIGDFQEGKEVRAYNRIRREYIVLIQEIRQRAAINGWPEECR